MSNSAEEIERGRAIAERAARELCQAQGRKQPRFEWGAATDTPQQLTILIENQEPIPIQFGASDMTAQGGIGAARTARRALQNALRAL